MRVTLKLRVCLGCPTGCAAQGELSARCGLDASAGWSRWRSRDVQVASAGAEEVEKSVCHLVGCL